VPLALVDDPIDAETNARIAAWIGEERRRDEGIRRSVVGGWHSRPDLPMRGEPALDALFAAVVEQVRRLHGRLGRGDDLSLRFMIQGWATALEFGDYVQVHDHADAHWSVVYYVDAGDSDEPTSGRIGWINPVGAHRELPGLELIPTTFHCTPRTGLLAVFPGWLRHAVEPYRGARPRLAISANLEVQRLPR
jgi:hypothetical protein